MRKLVMIITVLSALNQLQASVVCEKQGRYWRPKNDLAIKIAKSLNVKTCTGDRFLAVVKGIGETSNVVKGAKKMSTDDLIKSLKK